LNGEPAHFVFSTNAAFTDLQLTATVPLGATTGALTIETPHGNFSTTSNLTVVTVPRLTIQQLPLPNLVELSWPSTAGFNLTPSLPPPLGVQPRRSPPVWSTASVTSP
jgi:hypothetical protein